MKKECSTCGGTGQVGFFQGVSRFLLSWEECPECCGTGLADKDNGHQGELQKKGRNKNKQPGRKKKS